MLVLPNTVALLSSYWLVNKFFIIHRLGLEVHIGRIRGKEWYPTSFEKSLKPCFPFLRLILLKLWPLINLWLYCFFHWNYTCNILFAFSEIPKKWYVIHQDTTATQQKLQNYYKVDRLKSLLWKLRVKKEKIRREVKMKKNLVYWWSYFIIYRNNR